MESQDLRIPWNQDCLHGIYIQLKGASQVVPLVLQRNKQINLFNVLVGIYR